jgi:hypothetical protein
MKKLVLVLFLLAIAVLAYFSITLKPHDNSQPALNNTLNITSTNTTKENIASYLENQQIVKDLPKDAILCLKFYDFDSGERKWEDSYIIKKQSVQKGEADNADITILLHSKYIPEIGKGFCQAIQKAKNNNDFGTEFFLSTAQLLWKYKSMMSYRNCLGF